MNAMHHLNAAALRRRAQGFSLIEQLVALAVLSLGVLGISDLQLRGLTHAQDSLQRNQATALAAAMADLMRANADAAHAGAYALDPLVPSAGAPPDCDSQTCDPDALAAYDLQQWLEQVQASLPGAMARIACQDSPCTAVSVQTVWVYWQAGHSQATGLNCGTPDYDPAVDRSCAVLSFQP